MTDTFTLSIEALKNEAVRTHVQSMRAALKKGFDRQDPSFWRSTESLIKWKKGPNALRRFFVLECLDALKNPPIVQQRLAGAAYKMACQYAQKDHPTLKKRCYKVGLHTILQLAESLGANSTLPKETAQSLHRSTGLILSQMEDLFCEDALRQRGIHTLSLLAAKNAATLAPDLACRHLERAARMAGPDTPMQADVLSAAITHYRDILFHATAADKARAPLTKLICTLSGVNVVAEGFEASGLIIPPQQGKRPLEAFILSKSQGDAPPTLHHNGHILSFEIAHNVGVLRAGTPYKAPKLLEVANQLFEKALAAPPPLEALAQQVETLPRNRLLAHALRQRALYGI